jgi:hypothetical protein
MPKNPPAPLTTEQAIQRAQMLIDAAESITRPAEQSGASSRLARASAKSLRDHMRLAYRNFTTPSELAPILEALILAASSGAADPKGPQDAGS